jgi:hypothetical protein
VEISIVKAEYRDREAGGETNEGEDGERFKVFEDEMLTKWQDGERLGLADRAPIVC